MIKFLKAVFKLATAIFGPSLLDVLDSGDNAVLTAVAQSLPLYTHRNRKGVCGRWLVPLQLNFLDQARPFLI